MAYQDLQAFLVALSKHPSLRATLKKGGPAAENLLMEAGLTAVEKALVRGGNRDAIKKYLGDRYAAAAKVNIAD